MFKKKEKEKMEYAANGIITDTCNGNNANKDKYLISIIGMQDISNIKKQVQVRILQYWVKAASEGIKKTKLI